MKGLRRRLESRFGGNSKRAKRLVARLGALAAALAFGPADAGAATNITADTAPGVSLGTTVTAKGSVYTIDNGTLVGSNLFESFSAFSLAAGDTARWTYTAGNPAAITNLINRVTGGTPSNISGALNSTSLSQANLYFINPAGVVFGHGASVAVAGAAHFSTSSKLIFSDGSVFTATTPTGSTLSMASPSAFGFLGGEGDIAFSGVSGGFSKVVGGASFDAADVQASNSSLQFGHLDLIAAGNQTLAVPVLAPLSVGGFTGSMTLGASTLVGQGPASLGAAVNVGAGAITMTGGASIRSAATAAQDGGSLMVTANTLSMDQSNLESTTTFSTSAGDVVIATAGQAQLSDHSLIASISSNAGNAGSIVLDASSLSIDTSNIQSTALSAASGQSGAIRLEIAGTVTAHAAAIQTKDTQGDTGAIAISAQSLSMDQSEIISQISTAGASGPIDVDVNGPLVMSNQSYAYSVSGAAAPGTVAGPINLVSQSLVMNNSKLQSTSVGNVSAAALDVTAADGVTLNDSVIQSFLSTGVTGPVSIVGQSLTLNESAIFSEPSLAGPGGSIDINVAGPVSLMGQGDATSVIHSVSRGTFAGPAAGEISINAQSVVIEDSNIVTNSTGSINAGPIILDVSGPVSLLTAGGILSQAFSTGAGGLIGVTADSLLLVNGGGLISSTSGPGSAGSVVVDVSGAVDMANLGVIHSSSNLAGDGPSGNVTVRSATLDMESGAEIFTISASANSGGNVSVGNPDGSSVITINGHSTAIDTSNTAPAGGSGGDIAVAASRLVVSNGGEIHSDSSGGQAGSITLDFPNGGLLFVEGASRPGSITTNSASAQAGRIDINNPSAIILDGSDIEAQGPASGAFVTINSPAVIQSSDRENKFVVTGVVTLEGEYVDVASSVAISDLTFIDASKVLQGRCAALASSGETSRLTDTIIGPFGRERSKPVKAGTLAWRFDPPSTCGSPSAPN
jgi:filamentous hemagglutinin family protein